MAMRLSILAKHVRGFLRIYPREHRAEVRQAMKQLRVPLNRLAWEVLEAEQAGLDYAGAAAQDGRFGLLARVHHGVLDFLQLVLPPQMVALVPQLMRAAKEEDAVAFRRTVSTIATRGDQPEAALARFVIYEAMRLNVWLAIWKDEGGIEASGTMDEIDKIAQQLLERELRAFSPAYDEEPLPLLVAQCLIEMERILRTRHQELSAATAEFIREWNHLASGYKLARDLGAPEAILLRNALGKALGGEEIGAVQIANRHPLAFPSADAVYQRRHRLIKKGRAARHPAPRFIDLLLEHAEERNPHE